MTARNLLDKTYALLSRRPVYHALFWVVLFAAMVVTGISEGGKFSDVVITESISLFFYGILVYINLFYLIPNYLARHAALYFTLALVLSALVTPFKVLVLYLLFSQSPVFRSELIDLQGYIFLGNLLILLLSTVLRVIMDWWRYQAEKQTLVTQTMQSELRFLKSQINPHFLFNTLNNLYALTLKKSDRAPEIVLKLSEIMRYMLYECNEKQVLLSKEIQYMQNYLDLERLRQPEGAEISMKVEGHVSDQMVAPLLFIPFLENAFKHGLNNYLQGGGFVRLKVLVSDDDLEFTIENSKTESMPRSIHPHSGGIGLVNIRQRLHLLYPDQHYMVLNDEPNRFTVTLQLKMNR